MISFDALIRASQAPDAPCPLEYSDATPAHRGLRMKGYPLPVSISEVEANLLSEYAFEHDCVSGLDLATGFGISALAMSLGGCEIISIDNYAEEHDQRQQVKDPGGLHHWAIGLRMARWLANEGRVSPVDFRLGVAPYALPRDRKFDLVMLDCPKSDDDLRNLLRELRESLAWHWTLFLHDSHTMPHAAEIVRELLGVELVNVLPNQPLPFMRARNF